MNAQELLLILLNIAVNGAPMPTVPATVTIATACVVPTVIVPLLAMTVNEVGVVPAEQAAIWTV
jgi:hypothetical protein